MSALLAQQRRGLAEADFQETRPSLQWTHLALGHPPVATRLTLVPEGEARTEPEGVGVQLPALYSDLATVAWLDDDELEGRTTDPFEDADRQQWALVRLVCGTALAVCVLGLASHLVG